MQLLSGSSSYAVDSATSPDKTGVNPRLDGRASKKSYRPVHAS